MRLVAFGKTDFTYVMVLESRELLQLQCRKFAVLRVAKIQPVVSIVACFRPPLSLNCCIQRFQRRFDNRLDFLPFRGAKLQAYSHNG